MNILDRYLLAWLFEGTKLLFTQDQFPTGKPHQGQTAAIVTVVRVIRQKHPLTIKLQFTEEIHSECP